MAYKVLDIYRDLPLTNCGDCGRANCFAFASAVYLEGASPALCPHLAPERRAEMEAKLEAGRARGEGRRPESSEQAFEFLKGKLGEADLRQRAEASGAGHRAGPPEALELAFLGIPHRITRQDVLALAGGAPTVWVKIFLAIYATRASGAPPAGRWVAYRELPNTVSKAKSFERCAERVAEAFDGKLGGLEAACRALEGEAEPPGSADRAFRFRALPRVELLLLFWDRQEEFPARAALLVDGGVLEYLDQEALVFLAEAFVQRLLGGGIAGVVP